MEKEASRQVAFPMAPVTPVTPVTPVAPVAPIAPIAPIAAFPPGTPIMVAPVRRVVHPTQIIERHFVVRYPVVHVFPSHVRNVVHNVVENHCEYPCSENQEVCNQEVNHCPRPMAP